MKRFKRFFLIAVFAILPAAVFAQGRLELPFNRYYARVKKDDINVRARPSTSSEVMFQLDRGQDVLVIDESGDWVKIQPREGDRAWVHQDLVSNGLISKDSVNIRAGPSLSNSILGRLSEGDPVLEVSRQGEWIQIEMPRGFGYWVAKFLIQFLSPEDSYTEYLAKEKQARVDFKQAEEFRKKELTKRYQEVDYDAIIERYQDIMDQYPNTGEALKAHERVIDAREKKAMARQKRVTVQELRRVLRRFEEAETMLKSVRLDPAASPKQVDAVMEKYRSLAEQYPGTKEARKSLERLDELKKIRAERRTEWEKLRSFSAEGKLREYRGDAYPRATHLLQKGTWNRRRLCAVFSLDIDLRAYENKFVSIEGTIVKPPSEDTGYPLVEIEKIFLK
jgi:uncharacterized protein YgiM (DUF1202 family)